MNARLPRGSQGVALVLVLACLVIITILTVAFLQSVRSELVASTGYADGATTRMLADSTLNVVIGQIQEATQRENEAWVSQPGLLRCYDATGMQTRAYKLYSSDKLIVDAAIDGPFNPLDGSGNPRDIPADWKAQGTSVFTDLNEPILKGSAPHYPILDPAGLELASRVEGFSAPTEDLLDARGQPIARPGGGYYQKITMPVRWLYVLRDGTRATAAPGPDGTVKLTSVDPATAGQLRVGMKVLLSVSADPTIAGRIEASFR